MKYFLFLIVLMLNINVVLATPLIIQPPMENITLVRNVERSYIFNLTNNNDYALYDVQIEGDGVSLTGILPIISPHNSGSVNVSFRFSESGNFIKTLKAIGFTKINCSSTTQQDYFINVTVVGAYPRSVEICKNDNVKFNNNYGSTFFVDIPLLSIHQGVSNGGMHVQNFPNVGVYTYRIEPLIDVGTVNVKDTESKVHSMLDDGLVNINITVNLEETTLNAIFTKTMFNISYNSIDSSYFIVKNVGTKEATRVQLFCDWLSFDKNNFNLAAGEERAINFVVATPIIKTEDTNKTYYKTLYIRGDNFDEILQNMTIFVNYSTISPSNISSPEWWIKRKEFCTAFPNAPDCLVEPYVIYRDKVIYDAPPILANMSPADIKRYMDSVNGLQQVWENYNNNWKLDTDVMKNGITEFRSVANSSYDQGLKNSDEFKTFKNVFYIIMGTFVLCFMMIIIGGVLFLYYKSRIDATQARI